MSGETAGVAVLMGLVFAIGCGATFGWGAGLIAFPAWLLACRALS